MATKPQAHQLTPNNRIYLYQLLSRELGCGKQTFMPAVEEALASDRMTASDLGFESTRALLEALEEFIKLTVFKGGRIYATVIAQPAWDEALAAFASGKSKDASAPSNKPWKRKKADKTLKPVRPKRVKRPEPEPELIVEEQLEPEPSSADEAQGSNSAGAGNSAEAAAAADTAHAPASSIEAFESASLGEGVIDEKRSDEDTEVAADAQSEMSETASQPSPAISLTVTYDPYSGIDRETKLESHPIAPKPEQAAQESTCDTPKASAGSTFFSGNPAPAASERGTEPAEAPGATTRPRPVEPSQATSAAQTPAKKTPTMPAARLSAQPTPAQPATAAPTQPAPAQPVTAAPAQPAPLSPEVLATYPTDFSTEVYLASERIADLCELLPYGTDVFALLAEDYSRARTLELMSGTRARATFPLRIQHADSVEPILITLKKRCGSGLQWELSTIS